jgi:transposase
MWTPGICVEEALLIHDAPPSDHTLPGYDWGLSRLLHDHDPLKGCVQTWEQRQGRTLLPKQRQSLTTIGQILDDDFLHVLGRSHEDITADPHLPHDLARARRRYDAAMLKALRLGLDDHPLVHQWTQRSRTMGGRTLLRRAKRGLERGVRPLLEEDEEKLKMEILQRQTSGEHLWSIYQRLTNEKRMRGSWEGFRQFVHRHDLYAPPTPLPIWHIPPQVWDKIGPIIAQHDPPEPTGRPRIDPRAALEGILHRQRTHEAWRKLPPAFPDYRSVYRTFQRWQDIKLLDHLWPILQAECADIDGLHWPWQSPPSLANTTTPKPRS